MKARARSSRLWVVFAVLGALPGCITAPPIVLVDSHTALEAQAAGRFQPLEAGLASAAATSGPERFTSGQLAAAGQPALMADAELLDIWGGLRADAEVIDRLLRHRCLGEAYDGLLVERPETCTERVDRVELAGAVVRTNRQRRQVWVLVGRRRPGASTEGIRREWRERHLAGVVCGAPIQAADGTWGDKAC